MRTFQAVARRTLYLALLSALLPVLGGCGAEDARDTAAPMSFEEFEARTPRESGTGLYIVDGDMPVRTREELHALYAELHQPVRREGLAVYAVNGADVKWSGSAQRSLTYCVSLGFGGNHTAVVQAMAAAASAWEASANVDFIHLGDQDAYCTASNGNVVFDVSPTSGQPYDARAFFPNYGRTSRNILINSTVFGNIAPYTLAGVLRHELGHALGFRHEHIRPEAQPSPQPAGCSEDTALWRGLTSYDSASVMHYRQCRGTGTGDLHLTALDRQGVASLYPFPQGSDLVCNNIDTGSNPVASSLGSGFATAEPLLTTWCSGTSTRILTGDVNGDGRDDLLCNNAESASNWVAFSTGGGFSVGGPLLTNWCGADNTRLLAGDVNGDGKDDLICNAASTATNYVAFSTGNGFTVGGPLLSNWCGADNTRLLVGDVNGDSKADLICNAASSGSNYVAFSTGSGFTVGGPLLTNWCGSDNTRLLVGDVNGDGKDDLICNAAGSASTYVAFSTGSGFTVGGPLLTNWCGSNGTRLVVGDVDGNGREDLVCNTVGSGAIHVAFSSGGGFAIGGPLLTGWCGGTNTRLLAGDLN